MQMIKWRLNIKFSLKIIILTIYVNEGISHTQMYLLECGYEIGSSTFPLIGEFPPYPATQSQK